MRKSLTIAKRGAALVLAGAMVCGCTMGAAAESAVKKEETIYATLASDGSVRSITDSVWLHSDGSLAGYSADTGLTGVTMLKDTQTPSADGSRLTFADGTDAYYQGTADSDLPVSAEITYTLDGTQMSAEELAGKSGHLVMHIALTNHSYQMKTIGGESRRICTPFVTVVATTLDTDSFRNVTAENGTIETDSSKDLVAFVCLPGMKECFDGLLKGDMADLSDKMHDDVTVEADVTDFEMPMLYIAAATDAAAFEKEDELDDYDDLFDELDGLDDKLDDMLDGIQQLLDGSNTLNDGAGELYSGVQTLDNGAANLQSGAKKVADGAATAASGAATLSGGLNTLSGNSETLRGGTKQIADAVLASANSQLKAAGVLTKDMTWDDYGSVMAGILGVTDDMRNTAKETICAQAGGTLTDAQLNALVYLAALSQNKDATAAVQAAGAQMTQAAQDAAATGSIGMAQAALATAKNDPTAVPAVAAVLKSAAYQTVLAQVMAAGADASTAPLVLVYAAENYDTGKDLATNLQNAAAALTAVQTAQAVQNAIAAAGAPYNIPAVQAVLDASVPGASANYAAAYATLLTQMGKDPTDSATALVFTMACVNSTGDLSADLNTATATATAAQAHQAAALQAQTDLTTAGSADKVAAVDSILNGQIGTAYQTVAGQTGVSDDSVNALLITMACQAIAGGTATDLTTALTTAGTTLTNASTVTTALTRANDSTDTEAQQVVTAYLTNLVKNVKGTELEQVSDALDQLQQVQAFVQGINAYTAGVDTAAGGAAELASGLNTLKDGAATLASGTDTLKDGTGKLLNGVTTLKDGTGTLVDGVQELYDGINEAYDKIENNTDDLDLSVDDLQNLMDTLDAVKTQRESYTSFAGDAGSEGNVKFLMKVAAEKTEETETPAEQTTEPASTGNVFLDFWNRLVALFRK